MPQKPSEREAQILNEDTPSETQQLILEELRAIRKLLEGGIGYHFPKIHNILCNCFLDIQLSCSCKLNVRTK